MREERGEHLGRDRKEVLAQGKGGRDSREKKDPDAARGKSDEDVRGPSQGCPNSLEALLEESLVALREGI